MADRLLLKGGHVLTMDADLGDLTGDVLIEDGRIAAVVIDGSAVNVAPVIDPVGVAQRQSPVARSTSGTGGSPPTSAGPAP